MHLPAAASWDLEWRSDACPAGPARLLLPLSCLCCFQSAMLVALSAYMLVTWDPEPVPPPSASAGAGAGSLASAALNRSVGSGGGGGGPTVIAASTAARVLRSAAAAQAPAPVPLVFKEQPTGLLAAVLVVALLNLLDKMVALGYKLAVQGGEPSARMSEPLAWPGMASAHAWLHGVWADSSMAEQARKGGRGGVGVCVGMHACAQRRAGLGRAYGRGCLRAREQQTQHGHARAVVCCWSEGRCGWASAMQCNALR